MRSFDQLLGLLSNIPDPRRAEGKLYKLQHVLLFSILAVVTGGNSYRSIVTFIKVHRRRLNAAFGLHWRRAPAHTSIRYILQGLEPQAVEQIFRQVVVLQGLQTFGSAKLLAEKCLNHPSVVCAKGIDRATADRGEVMTAGPVRLPRMLRSLNEVDRMLERAREVTRNGKYTYIEYARFADDLVILIDAYKRHDWLVGAVDKRLREEFGKLQVEINDEKSRTVDLERGECFGFLGFDFRYLRSLRGALRPHYTPKLKKRTALMRELKEVFRRHRSQPIERVINLINPVLRGWVNYFAVGHSSECFSFIKDWVEKKVRRQLAHAQKRKGFGWKRWSKPWLYDTLGLFNAYRVRRDGPKVAPAG